jgi:hypothetical protein
VCSILYKLQYCTVAIIQITSSYSFWNLSALLTAVSVLAIAAIVTTITTNQEAYAQPSKPNHIRWCHDVTLIDSEGNIVTHQACAENKQDCRHDRERDLTQPIPPISVSDCYKQKLDELKLSLLFYYHYQSKCIF